MLKVIQKIPDAHAHPNSTGGAMPASPHDELWLDYDQRKLGRLRGTTAAGEDIGLFLERGEVLRDGDLLVTECGARITVRAASEEIAVASCDDWHLFSRACYHLGNRHVPLEIGALRLCFQRDKVLEELAGLLGLTVSAQQAPFNPEPGAYSGHGHRHAH